MALVDLTFLTNAELVALRSKVATELTTTGGKSIVGINTPDLSVTKAFGVTLDVLLRSVAHEYQRRGLTTTPRINRTTVQFS